MSNHSRRVRPSYYLSVPKRDAGQIIPTERVCSDSAGHAEQRFLLDAALYSGLLGDHSVCVERDKYGEVIAYWRSMRCGCTWMAFPVISEPTRSAAEGRQ